MDEHAVVSAAWAQRPIYARVVPWSERILGMTKPEAVAERERYVRGEVWCQCVSEVFPEGFEASIDVNLMKAISADEFQTACTDLRRQAMADDTEITLQGTGRRTGWLRRRFAAAS